MRDAAAHGTINRPAGRWESAVGIRPLVRPDEIVPSDHRKPTPEVRRTQLRLVPDNDGDVQQALPLVFESPSPFVPTIVETAPSPRLTSRPHSAWTSEQSDDEFFERQPTGRAQLPEPRAWAQRYGQAWVEVMIGRRAVKQLSRWSTPSVLAKLQQADPATSTARRQPPGRSQTVLPRSAQAVVGGVRVDEPADGVAEVAAVVRTRGRSRALTLRLEGWDGRWVCTHAAIL